MVCGAFVAIGVAMVESGDWRGWLPLVFFGLGVVAFGLQFLPNCSYLRIGPDGFTICALFRRHSYAWSEVGAFEVRSAGLDRMVVFTLATRSHASGLTRLNARLTGADAAIATSGAWSVSMEHLAELMNQYRERYRIA